MKSFDDHISIEKSDYDSYLGEIEHAYCINGIPTNVRLHYLKFSGNGQPMVKALANMLYQYIIDYCIAVRNRNDPLTPRQAAKLTKEARKLFRHPKLDINSPDKTGEAGELLLFFLLEAILKAPQMVAKMELKTNRRDEVKGSDGIHAKYNSETGLVDFYFGESKLYGDSSAAIREAIKSVEQFHDVEMYQHEFSMVTKHFKYTCEDTKEAVSSLIEFGEVGEGACVNHACLIGYDFKGYENLHGNTLEELKQNFLSEFQKDGARLTNLLQKRLDEFKLKHLNFEVFFIPFPSVAEFRNALNEALD